MRWHLNGNRKISESLRKEQENLIASGGQEKPRPIDDNGYVTIVSIHWSVKGIAISTSRGYKFLSDTWE
jgi:hypothetical protein